MGLRSFLTGSPKVVADIFDKDGGHLSKIGGWIGNQQFTEQERAEFNAGFLKGVQDYSIATLSENTDRSKARRDIAVFFIKFYSILVFMAGMTYPISSEWSNVWFSLATSLSVGGLVASISVFFFGSHAAARYKEGKKGNG